MLTFIEYELPDGTTILIQGSDQEPGGLVPVSRDKEGNVVKRAGKSLDKALDSIKGQAALLKAKLEDLRADEVEVSFGLATTGELGNFAAGKVGVEGNYSITLKWDNRKGDKKG
jgi:hypothetical protein